MKKFFGNKTFYKMLFAIMIPIILQQLLTQFVGLLDNLMVGQVGNSEMTGVALGNQILFIFNLCIFGSLSGASIFATQFFGAKDVDGYHETFKFKWLITGVIICIFSTVVLIFHEPILNLFINAREGEISDPKVVLDSATSYLFIMLLGSVPFAVKEIYATALREMKETLFPMICSIIAILVNLCLNYLLIFGKFGFPVLGVNGAAIATLISRLVEMLVIIIYTHVRKNKFTYIIGIYRHFIVKLSSIKKFLPKTLLLLSNEFFWSLGLTVILSCYSLRGLDVVSALNICNTVNNVFIIVGSSMGNAAGIILGNLLGSNQADVAKAHSYKIMAFCLFISIIFAIFMVGAAFLIPNFYKTSLEIKQMATTLIIIAACLLPFHAFNTTCYFILRAGGKVLLTIIFDSLFIWAVRLPLAIILANFTPLSIIFLFLIVDGVDALKAFVGYGLVSKGIWLHRLV